MTRRSTSRSGSRISGPRALLLVGAACASACGGKAAARSQAHDPITLAFVDADIRTMDPANPHATAVAIAGAQIVAVGTDAEITALVGTTVGLIDLHGHTITPGLVDAHCHLAELGSDLDAVSVRGLTSEQAVAEAVKAAAADRVAGEWLQGSGWDQNLWPGQQFPTAASLDAVVSDRPVVLDRVDGHAVWLNSRALAAAHITKATQDPDGGRILRAPDGQPTGVLIDNATKLVAAVVPVATPQVRERQILAAAQVAIAAGLTGVHEMGITDETAAVYRQLAADGKLPLRVYAFLRGDPDNLARIRQAPQPDVGRFAMRGVKFFADGALGSRGARLIEPYDDDPGNKGLWVTPPDALGAVVDAAVATGWQVATHAIGDAGVMATIDAYYAAMRKYEGDRRLRIEHAQVMPPDDFDRVVEGRMIASMQPTHATSDMPWAEQRIGPTRIKYAYAWRTMLAKGIPLAFGSDFPVERVSPLLGLYAAVTRQDADGKPEGGWYPKQRLTLDEAIAAFTRGAAYAQFADDTRGMIAVGRDADLTVFDRPLAPDHSLLETTIDYTIVGGQPVYRSTRAAGAAQ